MANKKEKEKERKFNFSYYYTVYKLVIKLFEGKYKPVIDKEAMQNMDKPCLIFANHGSVFDFILAGSVIMPKKAVFVTTKRTMFNKGTNWVVSKAPHILRDQFSADVKSILEMKDAIKQGYNVVLYPEGKVSTSGVTSYIPKATGKLVKMFKVPVVTIVSKGNWLLKPSWASHIRTGHVEVSSKLLLTEEQIKSMTADQIQELIENALYYNENEYQLENNYEFYNIKKKKDFAGGLEKILYKCPVCGKEFVMKTEKNDIFCTECGYRATYNHNGLITSEKPIYDRIDKWFEYEKDSVKEELKSDDFKILGKVVAEIENGKENRYDNLGVGTLEMDKHNITFTSDSKDIKLTYNIDKVECIPFVVGKKICLVIEDKYYEFRFEDKLMSTKYNIAVELLAGERNAKKKKRANSRNS